MNTSSMQSSKVQAMLLAPEPWSLDGVAFFDEEGHEVAMTQEMILRACEELLRRINTSSSED